MVVTTGAGLTAGAGTTEGAGGDSMATNFAKADYQEIIDLHTEADKVSLIGIHTPVGNKPRQMLAGFFAQFRKFRYSGCDLVMVPAARLPADPLGVSYEAGEPGSDPRDLLNPILFHGCHGDNLNAALNSIYKGTFDLDSTSIGIDVHAQATVPAESISWEQQYYRALSDPTFSKSNIMSAFRKKGLHPMVYNVVSNLQMSPTSNSGFVGELDWVSDNDGSVVFDGSTNGGVPDGDGAVTPVMPHFTTNKLTALSWLDTKQVINSGFNQIGTPANTTLPKIFMGLLMLPPAYKTEMYFRLVITHHFQFKQFNTSLTNEGAVDYFDFNGALSESKASQSLELVNSTAEVATEGVF